MKTKKTDIIETPVIVDSPVDTPVDISVDIEAEKQTMNYIQESFIKESHGSISDDFAKSDKRMIDHTINLEAMKYISEFLGWTHYKTFEEASLALIERWYQIVADPTKLEYWKYTIRFDILQAIANKSVSVVLKSDIKIENV